MAYETGARESIVHQQVWVLEGTIDVTFGDGEPPARGQGLPRARTSIALSLHNPTDGTARYAVVIASEPEVR